MVQKTTWMHLLLIGLISISMAFSCNKQDIDKVTLADYIYSNSTLYEIKIDSYSAGKLYVYLLSPNESLKLSEDLFAGSNDSVIIHSDSVRITLNSKSELNWYPAMISSRNPIRLDNYEHKILSNRHHEYRFSFLESDFD